MGLNTWQKVLLTVGNNPNCTTGLIIQELKSNRVTIGETVRSLEEQGYITIEKDGVRNCIRLKNVEVFESLKALNNT